MKKKVLSLALAAIAIYGKADAQSMHFSQYYNAPLLLNPANTALLPEHDYRVGANYRNQWASVPVPYSTFSAYTDFQLMRGMEKYNCFGLGAAVFTDRAGDGQLSLTRGEAFLAYHLQLGESSILSLGGSASFVQRSVDYDKLTFDFQWDGFKFNKSNANGEGKQGLIKTNYTDICVGLNYSYFNDNIFFKLGGGVANVNQPKESFYGGTNEIGMRPTANVDVTIKAARNVIVNPSVYYTTQKDAYELVYGSLFRFNIRPENEAPVQLILGGYNRWAESIIGAMGVQWGSFQLMANYDHTISTLSVYNNGRGAMEFSLIYLGLYPSNSGNRKMLGCPRF